MTDSSSRKALASRWETREGQALAEEVFARLLARKPLGHLGLGEHEGRTDLRGILAPRPERLRHVEARGWFIEEVGNLVRFRGTRFEDLDLSHAALESFRFFNSSLTNCRFMGAQLCDWRLWATDVMDTTFEAADLRQSVLGAWYEGRGNTYRAVDFSRADLRGMVSHNATFTDCDFSRARLVKIDFQSSSFIRCRFAGELREVTFWNRGFGTEKLDPNPMEDVDFAAAQLRWVDFRGLNLDRVILPKDPEHVVIENYRCVLERALEALQNDNSLHARAVRTNVEQRLRWVGPEQRVGVFNLFEFSERGGKAEAEFALHLLRRCEMECMRS